MADAVAYLCRSFLKYHFFKTSLSLFFFLKFFDFPLSWNETIFKLNSSAFCHLFTLFHFLGNRNCLSFSTMLMV